LRTGRALLSVTTVGSSPHLLACGAAIALDLAPGRYWIRGQTRTTIYSESCQPPLPSGFMYRVSKPGDASCPAQLATRGVHDWDGAFPFEVTRDWLVDGDTKRDFRVDYQMAFMNPGTRLLVNAPYPACQRVVADVPAKLQPLPLRSHGYRDFRFAFWELHPVPGFGGRVVTEYPASYSPVTGSYEVGNSSFTPEKSNSVDAGVKWKAGPNSAQVSAYYTRFQNFLTTFASGLNRAGDGSYETAPGSGVTPRNRAWMASTG
jgi:hypothetical protein